MRVIVTGSRNFGLTYDHTTFTWIKETSEIDLIYRSLDEYLWMAIERKENLTIVHGNCPTGADQITSSYVQLFVRFLQSFNDDLGIYEEPYSAHWGTYGHRAGYVRNKYMVDLGADFCTAFIKDQSKGATMCARLAEEAGIPTYRSEIRSRSFSS